MNLSNPTFELAPGIGALPLRLGMTLDEVTSLLGPAKPTKANDSEQLEVQFYPWCVVSYLVSDQTLQHIGFGRHSPLRYNGKSPFHENSREFFNEMLALDAEPYAWKDTVYFLKLKLWITGFFDEDPSDQALSLFLPGVVDTSDLIPYKVPLG
jgi:hypothetical protein